MQLRSFLNCGSVITKKTREVCQFRVTSLNQILTNIITHFCQYPLCEGNFFVDIIENAGYKVNFGVTLKFRITQHSRDHLFIESFITYFNCGHIYVNDNSTEFRVTKFLDIENKIIPILQQHKFIGLRYLDFLD